MLKAATLAAASLAAMGLLNMPGAHAAANLIENVHGYTLAGDRLQRFGSLVFDGGKVIRTGDAAALHRAFPDANPIDGQGKTLLPGLIDAHGHVIDLGFEHVQIQLTGTSSLGQAQERVRAYARTHAGLAWYQGDGWNQVLWKLGRFPLASELDAAVADRPVVLSRVDGHAL